MWASMHDQAPEGVNSAFATTFFLAYHLQKACVPWKRKHALPDIRSSVRMVGFERVCNIVAYVLMSD